MKSTIGTKIAATALAVAAAATIGGVAGTGAASASAAAPKPVGKLVGPFGSASICISAYGRPMLPRSECFYNVSPAGWYFIGSIGA